MGCECNQPTSYNPCCENQVAVREEGQPGPPGPPATVPTPQVVSVTYGTPIGVTITPAAGNVWQFAFVFPFGDLLTSNNTWSGTNTFQSTVTFLNGATVGSSGSPQNLQVWGGIYAPNIPAAAPGNVLTGVVSLRSDGYLVVAPLTGVNVVNVTTGITPIVIDGGSIATNIGPALPFNLGATTNIRVRAKISFNEWIHDVGPPDIMVFTFKVYLDGADKGGIELTDYQASGELNIIIDGVAAGSHNLQIKCEGFNGGAGSVEVFSYLLDARW